MAQPVISPVITRIDYCNCVLASLPAYTLAPLQRVQNVAARLVLNLDWRSYISPALQQLHWLSVKYCDTFKIATLMHQILHNRCPSYLVDLVVYNVTDGQWRQLRSSTTRAAVVRRTWTQFGNRAFSVCGPDVWNSLLSQLETLTIIQHSDEHSSRICSIVLFPRNCLCSLYWLCNAVGLVFIVGLGTITFYCIVLYCND